MSEAHPHSANEDYIRRGLTEAGILRATLKLFLPEVLIFTSKKKKKKTYIGFIVFSF